MKRFVIGIVCSALLLGTLGVGSADEDGNGTDPDDFVVTERVYGGDGKIHEERGYMRYDPELGFLRGWTHKENHGGNGGGGGGGGGGGSTDCTSTKYALTGHFWTTTYSASASSYASVLDKAGNTWAAASAGSFFGSITSGSSATAGDQDFVNQMDWTDLGSGGTIAVTTTWYYRSSGEAVESDAQYNTYYPWSTNGDPNAMDVEAIGAHEIGHTFGLDHPNGPASQIGCLTMYAYADYGDTHQRTLGDGDILGIQDLYG